VLCCAICLTVETVAERIMFIVDFMVDVYKSWQITKVWIVKVELLLM